jgi:hypothetical protein
VSDLRQPPSRAASTAAVSNSFGTGWCVFMEVLLVHVTHVPPFPPDAENTAAPATVPTAGREAPAPTARNLARRRRAHPVQCTNRQKLDREPACRFVIFFG